MIATYRYIKRKRASTPSSSNSSPRSKTSSRSDWIWKLRLPVALFLPVFLETLDYTVVATAQPMIASVFNRLDLQSYIGTAFLLTSTVFLPFFASVADIYGRHFAIQSSLLFFMLGSAISTGAQNMAMMLAGRGIAGVGAAGLLAVVRTIMADSRSLASNNWQTSVFFLLYAIGFSVGPVIGGALLNVSFRWIFAINLPACAVAIILCFLLLRNHVKRGQPSKRLPETLAQRETYSIKLLRIDWIGTTLFISAGILFLLGLNWGSTEIWNTAKVIACLVVGGVLFVACIIWEYYLERQGTHMNSTASTSPLFWADPMIPLDLFRNYDTSAVQAASFIGGMVMLVMFYFVGIYATIVSGLSPNKAGVQLVYFAPGSGGGTLISVYIIKFTGQPKYAIILGSIVIPVALGLISMGIQEDKQSLVNGFMVMAGVGCGLTMGSLAIQARFSQPVERVAAVSALILFFRALGGTVGLAQCAAVLNSKVKIALRSAVASGVISSADAASLDSQGNLSSVSSISGLSPDLQSVIRDAYRNGVRWCFISLIPWAAVALFLTLALSHISDTNKPEAQPTADSQTDLDNTEKSLVEAKPSEKDSELPTSNQDEIASESV